MPVGTSKSSADDPNRIIWLAVRRAFLMVCAAIEKAYGKE